MLTTVLLILPDFILITLGAALRHVMSFSADFFRQVEKLVYYLFFPALLFTSIVNTPLEGTQTLNLLLAVSGVIATGAFAGWLARRVLQPNALVHASVVQCAFRFNTYLTLSLAFELSQQEGLGIMSVIVGLAVPLVNFLAVHALARQRGRKVSIELLSNPFILAAVLGLLWNFLALPIPKPIEVGLARLGSCALPLGLLCVGATISLNALHGAKKLVAWVVSCKLLLLPIAAVLISRLLKLDPVEANMLILFAAVPTASSAHVLAARMGGNAELVATTMSTGTILAIFTLPLCIRFLFT